MQTDFAHLRRQLLDAGLQKYLPAMRAEFDESEQRRRELEHCATGAATPACKLQVRFLYQVLRSLPSPSVFAQLVCGFELASADPLIVGINMVQPEDHRPVLANYRLQMQMVQALHILYPKVHITLHAGELGPGMVQPDDLRFHIRSAVEVADAERIGHGVDVMQEDHPYDLLKEMATKRVMVEINLTSNDVILNVKGPDHPLPMYRLYHVPVALSTDDEGVSRINLTHEYVRAAMAYPLTYSDFKQMVRTGLEHSFLPGERSSLVRGKAMLVRAPRAPPSLAATRLRERARRCSKPAKRRGSNSNWNGGFMFSRAHSSPERWRFLHAAHLHCRSSACVLFSLASARLAISIRS
jgi:adenosine deaminase